MTDSEYEAEANRVHARGNDWEVVSLTKSAYDASPGLVEPRDEEGNINYQEKTDGMFMSQHFAFPPIEHENLPVEHVLEESNNDGTGPPIEHENLPEEHVLEESNNDGTGKTVQESWKIDYDDTTLHELGFHLTKPENISIGSISKYSIFSEKDSEGDKKSEEKSWMEKSDERLGGVEFFGKGKGFSFHSMEIGDLKALQGAGAISGEQGFYDVAGFSSLVTQASETTKKEEPSLGSLQNAASPSATNEENRCVKSVVPCEVWWKRHATYLFNHAKEANTFWSIFVAAAVMGLVILGQQWQREKSQLQHLKCHFSVNEERTSRILGPITRIKEVLINGQHRRPLIHGAAAPSS